QRGSTMRPRAFILALFVSACGSGGGDTPTTPMGVPAAMLPTLQTDVAFPALSFSNPVLITNAKDGTDRLFVVEQAGRILVFPNDDAAASTKVFLDIRNKVLLDGE